MPKYYTFRTNLSTYKLYPFSDFPLIRSYFRSFELYTFAWFNERLGKNFANSHNENQD